MINDITGRLIADKYRVEGLIRESELGDLFHGRHEVLDKPVTLKILAPAYASDSRRVRRFIEAARSTSTLTHPNILALTDFGTDVQGVTYAVFERAEDSTLAELISVDSQLEPFRAVEISRQITAALSTAHAKDLIHARLDPKNVFLGSDDGVDTVKVHGFGGDPLEVARDADPRYLAPEQSGPFAIADRRSDVYTLGVILYEMLAGEVPFKGTSFAEVAQQRTGGSPAELSDLRPDLPSEIQPVVFKAMAADRENRYQTIDAFAEDLNILAGKLGGKGKAKAAGAGRNVWQTAFVVLVGICVLAVALIYATSNKKTDPTTQLQAADAGSLPVQPIGPATGAQEESLARLPVMTDAEIMATSAMGAPATDVVPGGDGFNAWANGGVPPPGAPLQQYVPPGGQVYTIDPNSGSQFMPNDSGVILVPVPVNTPADDPKASQSPKVPAANTAAQPTPAAGSTPKPMATPPPKTKPGAAQPKAKTPAADSQQPSLGPQKDS